MSDPMIGGDRILVDYDGRKSWGTVFAVFPGEIYPIQVELDDPDEDGHSMKRISKQDIDRGTTE